MKSQKYCKVERQSKRIDERNDCTVRALALAGRVDYLKAHAACRMNGRKDCQGMYEWQVKLAAESLGLVCEEMRFDNRKHGGIEKSVRPLQPNGSRYTVKTIGRLLKKGYYIVYVNGHALTVINGEVHDWTDGRRHQITRVQKITKPRGWSSCK